MALTRIHRVQRTPITNKVPPLVSIILKNPFFHEMFVKLYVFLQETILFSNNKIQV